MRLPEFVTELSPVRETLEALEAGEASLSAEIGTALRQLYPDTADRALSLWEADFSLSGKGPEALRRAAVKAALAGGRTLTPAYLEELCRLFGGGDWSQVNEDFSNWTVTVYAAALGKLLPGAEILESVLERLKPAHLRLELHPAGVFPLEGGWRSALKGGACGELSGGDALPAPAERRAALTGGAVRELAGGDSLRAGSFRRTGLAGTACRELSGGDAFRAGTVHGAVLAGGTYLELRGTDRRWDRFARRGTVLTGCMHAETAGRAVRRGGTPLPEGGGRTASPE